MVKMMMMMVMVMKTTMTMSMTDDDDDDDDYMYEGIAVSTCFATWAWRTDTVRSCTAYVGP
eukprot:3408512-Karenia_brevis.AAC.1